ncbi:ADP-ribose pyrophosphatase YjhB, NUDIX family [Nitrosomonas sp. PY1]|uniref:NUDIX hydrolase n=1 Tax=Nitrosomonas sp. PY1 TaxID=1803906 RepID=UPI001FC7FDAC|nr:NUDIX hydrolase [Nitrosomonas sp. PY1]GKS69231.1 ADP-ribose pyrophosphatase YjhB, NUDIX family [Nitrosomonas sp. PY1]
MKFCSNCSASVELRIPEGDSLPRYVCTVCHIIHYQNPKVVVGCIPEWEDKVLLCRRAIEPRLGWWTLPAGFMENNETLEQAAARETLEEANARVEIGDLYAVYSLPYISQVYFLFRGKLLDLNFKPGIESLEVALLSEHEIPWQDMAFRVIHDPLKRYFEERSRNALRFYMDTIDKPRTIRE